MERFQSLLNIGNNIPFQQLPVGKIDAHVKIRLKLTPFPALLHRMIKHPASQRDDQAALLQQGDKFTGRYISVFGTAPSGQRLRPVQGSGLRLNLWLITDGKTRETTVNAFPQKLCQLQLSFLFLQDILRKSGNPVLSLQLGMLQGIVGAFEQIQIIIRIRRIYGIAS